ncbi:hypothetical protein OED52_05305 [Rhodococcus sp. Z13]|uniref:Uncharacterized protein n=1 Tax=Rhodococcus sacchari TaxID=2962047 RepID=A0ACD4DMA3_9NOCA|nr:hypothetical protein [Rhodococcus sp. Z13]UYP21157.1 hypothetical protein OED52_05305 [Rhodococcus sp. Z13]
MSVSSGITRPMTALTALGLIVTLCLGTVLGWPLRAARDGDRAARTEAQPARIRICSNTPSGRT